VLTESLPAEWYVDAGPLRRERETAMRDGWHYAGDATVVAAASAFSTTVVAGLPIVVTRDRDGGLHALANVCVHRGCLVANGTGSRSTLQCGYHGWTYRLDGRLHRAPGVPDPGERSLPRLHAATVGPLLFVSAAAAPQQLADSIAPFTAAAASIGGVDPAGLSLRRQVEHTVRANWKVVVENFIECYHCPLVHASTLPGYGREDYLTERHGPLMLQRLDRERFAFAFLFPATQLSVYGDAGALVARCLAPVAPDMTEIRLDYWFAADVGASEADRFVDWFEQVVAEDIPLCESVQTGLSSGLLPRGLLDPVNEPGPVHFQSLLRSAVGDG
jgi:choline monooxygenase